MAKHLTEFINGRSLYPESRKDIVAQVQTHDGRAYCVLAVNTRGGGTLLAVLQIPAASGTGGTAELLDLALSEGTSPDLKRMAQRGWDWLHAEGWPDRHLGDGGLPSGR